MQSLAILITAKFIDLGKLDFHSASFLVRFYLTPYQCRFFNASI